MRAVPNRPHAEGGCLEPIQLLADLGATDIVVGGIGRRPLLGFQEAGIAVFLDDERLLVGDAFAAWVEGLLPRFTPALACQGASGCQGSHPER
jgi:predicted Fe-Mo cluster-binding NifX family protein